MKTVCFAYILGILFCCSYHINLRFTNDGYLSSKHVLKVLSCNEMVKED